jgi:hypothetical protein
MLMSIWSKSFWKATGERAVKTFAQTGVSVLLVGNVSGVLDADWLGVGSAAALAAIISLLTSIGSNGATGDGPSLSHAEQVVPQVGE